MKLSLSLRRKLRALTIAHVDFITIGLGSKLIHGPDWLAFLGVTLGVLALAALLILADGIACAADRRAKEKSQTTECFT